MTFRAYNDGVAYRFYTTVTSEVTVKDEVAEFNFPQDYTAYLPYTTNDKQPMAMAFQNVYDITLLCQKHSLNWLFFRLLWIAAA